MLAFLNFMLLAPDLFDWFGQKGVVTPAAGKLLSGGRGINLFDLLPQTDGSVLMLFLVAVLSSLTLSAGFFTRTSALILFLAWTSFCHRNTILLNSGDSILRLTSFFLIFSPAGAIYSLDRYLAVKKGTTRGPAKLVEPWTMRLLQIQVCLIYLYTFTWKIMGGMWLDGTALYYTSRLQEFWRFPMPYAFEHMWTIKLATWGTLVLEFALGALLWIKELRYPILIGGVFLHLGIDYTMNIPLFGQLMMCTYILFVDAADIDRAIGWAKRKLPFLNKTSTPAPAKNPGSSTRRPAQTAAP
jgi:hypothetical protein